MTVTVKTKDHFAVDDAVGASWSQCSTSSRGDGACDYVLRVVILHVVGPQQRLDGSDN